MVAPKHEHSHNKDCKHSIGRAFNTSENAKKSIITIKNCLRSLSPGKVWHHRGAHGELEIKASLLLDHYIITALHFSPEDGSLLPKGLHGFGEVKDGIMEIVQNRLQEIPMQLCVLDGAEFREPESCWAVPLTIDGRIVAHVKVTADGTEVLPDKKATEESDRHQKIKTD